MIFKLMSNLGLIIRSLRSIEEITAECVSTKKISVPNIKKFIDVCRELLDSGVIDIPGIDEHAIAAALKQVEDNL